MLSRQGGFAAAAVSKHPPAGLMAGRSGHIAEGLSMRQYFVYMAASPSRTLYIGVTNDLERRMWEHKQKLFKGFTAKHGVDRLVYTEDFANIDDAIAREKQLKGWRRDRKVALIERENPTWRDLSCGWFE